MQLGSAIHEVFLQPESFSLEEDLGRPSAKLGDVFDYAMKQRAEGKGIYDSIVVACNEICYYANSLTANRVKQIISKGFPYYVKSKIAGNTDKVRECLDGIGIQLRLVDLIRMERFGDCVGHYLAP